VDRFFARSCFARPLDHIRASFFRGSHSLARSLHFFVRGVFHVGCSLLGIFVGVALPFREFFMCILGFEVGTLLGSGIFAL
jgi:hypothetical protein